MKPHPSTEAAAEVAAWWRLVELCLPSHEACGAATFRPAGAETLGKDWEEWVREIFHPVLRPSLFSLQAAAAAQDVRTLAEVDGRLGFALPGPAAQGSLAAGRRVLFGCVPPQGSRMLERLRSIAGNDGTVGHMATVFSARAHVFHLPSVQMAGAMLLAECVLGAESVGVVLSASRTVEMLQGVAEPLTAAPAVHVIAV
ncbi:MAG: hypothetical protein IAE97_08805 [Chthoniobacterales bacterium]|nr:hypothetical protein [Chthoniobacterales bacterium]